MPAMPEEGNQLRLRRAVKDSQAIREERRGSEGTLWQRRPGVVRGSHLLVVLLLLLIRLAAVRRERGLSRAKPARELVRHQAL